MCFRPTLPNCQMSSNFTFAMCFKSARSRIGNRHRYFQRYTFPRQEEVVVSVITHGRKERQYLHALTPRTGSVAKVDAGDGTEVSGE